METGKNVSKLSSLSEWSVKRIQDIFEARTDEQSLRSIAATFSEDLDARINGAPLNREGIKQLVLAMRKGSAGGLKVQWQQAVEVPRDPSTNRDGSFGGMYIIRGLRKQLPGKIQPADFERHKTVTVKIESQSPDEHLDSRRIVSLVFVASDVRVDQQARL